MVVVGCDKILKPLVVVVSVVVGLVLKVKIDVIKSKERTKVVSGSPPETAPFCIDTSPLKTKTPGIVDARVCGDHHLGTDNSDGDVVR